MLLVAYHTNLLSFNLSNKLNYFLKFAKNSFTFIIFNIFGFEANYAISKSAT